MSFDCGEGILFKKVLLSGRNEQAMKFYEANEYQGKVNAIFTSLSSDLSKVLPHARIEHIGASSIPNSVSKGDIDVFVGVEQKDFEEALEKIKLLGFHEKNDTLRTNELCMLITDKYNYDVAVQLVANNSQFEDFIQFRDFMRQRPDLVDELNILKRKSEGMSPEKYREVKSKWVENIINQYLS